MARENYSFRFRAKRTAPQASHILTVLVATAIASAGCGGGAPPTAHLQGKVTIDGQPLPADAEGSISFQPSTGDQTRAVVASIVNSTYDSPQTPTGQVLVRISVTQPTGGMLDNGRGDPSPEYRDIVPPGAASAIELEVAGDKDDQNFDLKAS
jgi:hypothetical protein